MTALENELKIASTDIIFKNISEATFKAAAEVFIYISPLIIDNSCPFKEFNKWFSIWSPFYKDLFKTQPADKIVLTLNRIITSQLRRNAAKDILSRTATLLSLNYKSIQSRLPRKSRNAEQRGDSQILESDKGICWSDNRHC